MKCISADLSSGRTCAACYLGRKAVGHAAQARPLNNSRGFTLIEVLTTMVVMAIVLPIAMHGISVSLHAAEMAKRTALAATLADGKLNDLVSSTASTSAGTQSGDFSPDYPGYQWQATTTSLALGLEQVDVQVSWTSRDGPRKLTVSTVLYPQTGSSS